MRITLPRICIGLAVPIAYAESKKKPKEGEEPCLVKPSDLPFYDAINCKTVEHHEKKPFILPYVPIVRKEVQSILKYASGFEEQAIHIYETGVAHTATTIQYLREDVNYPARIGFIAFGGLTGLLLARKGFFRKIFYLSAGLSATSSICYPEEAKAVVISLPQNAQLYGAVAYNFIVGVQSNDSQDTTVKESASPSSEDVSLPVEETVDKKSVNEVEKKEDSRKTSSAIKSKTVEGDYGQSNPEDEDMYSTRR